MQVGHKKKKVAPDQQMDAFISGSNDNATRFDAYDDKKKKVINVPLTQKQIEMIDFLLEQENEETQSSERRQAYMRRLIMSHVIQGLKDRNHL